MPPSFLTELERLKWNVDEILISSLVKFWTLLISLMFMYFLFYESIIGSIHSGQTIYSTIEAAILVCLICY